MMSEQIYNEEHNTVILFKKSFEGDLTEISCPLFEHEIEPYIQEQLNGDNVGLEMMAENIFKFVYEQEYKHEIQIQWPDFIQSRLEAINTPFNPGIEIYQDEKQVEYEILNAEGFFFLAKDEETNILVLYFHIECPVYWVSEITREITLYTENYFQLEIGKTYFKDINHVMYFGIDALNAYQKQKKFTINKN